MKTSVSREVGGKVSRKMHDLARKANGTYFTLINYCLIGLCGASIDFIIFSVATHYAGVHYQYANLISVSCGIINNFLLNAFFNFRTTNHFALRMLSFYLVGMTGWAMSALVLYFLIELNHFHVLIAKLTTIILITFVQFTLNRLVTFRRRQYDTL